MNIPKKDVVSFVLSEALRERKAYSQKMLADALNARFRKSRSGFRVSSSRARKIALLTPGIRAKIHTRRGPVPGRCPACGYSLKKTFTRNLKNRKLLNAVSCQRCPYRGSDGKWVPKRYEFWSS
jgi:predicted RNA-binding Zn-ribbon protein involved in translation (DUF1610 family)